MRRFAPVEVVVSLKFTVFGLGESEVAQRLDGLTAGHPEVAVGYYPVFRPRRILLSLRTSEPTRAEALLGQLYAEAEHRLGGMVVAQGEQSLAGRWCRP